MKYEVKGSKLYVNNELQKKLLLPPRPKDLFPDAAEQQKMNVFKFDTSKQIVERASTSVALITKAGNITEEHTKKSIQKGVAAVPQCNPCGGGVPQEQFRISR